MVENQTIFGLVNPIPAMPEAEQKRLLSAKFQIKDWFVVGKDGDLCDLPRMFRPGRLWAVAHIALIGEQTGGKDARVDSMIATKVAADKRGTEFIDIEGQRTGKDWRKMKPQGERACAGWAKGRKSIANGRKGGRIGFVPTPAERAVMREEWFSKQNRTIQDAVDRIKKRLGKRAPGRTTLYKLLGAPYVRSDE